jgi:hypothetical protein
LALQDMNSVRSRQEVEQVLGAAMSAVDSKPSCDLTT